MGILGIFDQFMTQFVLLCVVAGTVLVGLWKSRQAMKEKAKRSAAEAATIRESLERRQRAEAEAARAREAADRRTSEAGKSAREGGRDHFSDPE